MAKRRRAKHKKPLFRGEPQGLESRDSIGNRISAKDRLPPDNIGNRLSSEDNEQIVHDGYGNRIDFRPTHWDSGVLQALDTRKPGRKRRSLNPTEYIQIGSYILGGVNPLVSMDAQRSQKFQEDNYDKAVAERKRLTDERQTQEKQEKDVRFAEKQERLKLRGFDFSLDDKYTYTLTSQPEEKRLLAEQMIVPILSGLGREAVCVTQLIEDGIRPKVLISIEEKGALSSIDAEKLHENAAKPLFTYGSMPLISLNFIMNKIINRYPKDRIRLIILPHDDIERYLKALKEHQALRVKKVEPVSEKIAEMRGTTNKSPKEEQKAEVTKKAATKKAVTKKAATKKAATKKAATKKAATKKAATKKAVTKKAATKKAVTKKAVKKVSAAE